MKKKRKIIHKEKVHLINEIFNYLAILSVFWILLYRIESLRQFCKSICLYMSDWFLSLDLNRIIDFYFVCESIARKILILFIIYELMKFLGKFVWKKWLNKQDGDNRFEKSLFRYLRESNIPRCFLISGDWGTGKTYEINHFFDKYYGYNNENIYRISCFGLDTRERLINEINLTIERKDDSFYTFIIQTIQFIPIIGELLSKVLRKSYSYTSVNKKSIFIFDDFERITSKVILDNNYRPVYKKNAFLLDNHRGGRKTIEEFKEIKKEFETLEKSFKNLETVISKNVEKTYMDKYNVVVGLINDLIETYGMKVIIICNSDVLGEKFIHEVLRSKLNCIEYRKTISFETKKSTIKKILDNYIWVDSEKQMIVDDFINKLLQNISNVVLDNIFDNLRIFGSLIEAFIMTVNLFDKNTLNNSFLNSLLNSIMIVHLLYYKKNLTYLDRFETGANIEFLMELYYKSSYKTIYFDEIEKARWIDISVSGYWIFNLSIPKNIEEIEDKWKKYHHYQLEENLVLDRDVLNSVDSYDLIHLFYYQLKTDFRSKEEWKYEDMVDKVFSTNQINNCDEVNHILDTMFFVFKERIYEGLFQYIFKKILECIEIKDVEGNTHIHDSFREYLQDNGIH